MKQARIINLNYGKIGSMKKAVFLDRDGTLVKLVYNPETENIDSVGKKEDIEITYDFPEVLVKLKSLGYLLILISNQPRIGLKKETKENFEAVRREISGQMEKEGVRLDAEYYCFHHPFAYIEEHRQNCDCRKPGTKFFKDTEKEFNIDLTESWMIGDGVTDVQAGFKAGVKTILFGNNLESGYLSILQEQLGSIRPDFIVKKPKEILDIIKK